MSKVALVVGASRGIGRQIAIDLAKNGYKGWVFLGMRSELKGKSGHFVQEYIRLGTIGSQSA